MAETWTIDARELAGLRNTSPAALRRRWGDTLEMVIFTQDLLRTPRLAEILAKVDTLLPVHGRLSVDCVELSDRGAAFRRSAPQIQYAIGCLFAGAYELVERKGAVQTFAKRADRRQYADELSSLSIGVITDGRNLESLLRLCEVATNEAPLLVELLVCGPIERLRQIKERFPRVILVEDVAHGDLRAPINKKKLHLIERATKENLVLLHDRFFLDRVWYERLMAYGNNFDFYRCRWCDLADYPREVRAGGDFSERPHPVTGFTYHAGSSWAAHPDHNPNWYLNGGIYIGKTRIFREVGFPSFLHWGDMEDVHFSRQLQLGGWVVHNDWSNRVFTTTLRLGRYARPWYIPLLRFVRRQAWKLAFWLRYRTGMID
jgi:hypothetical protein